MRTNKTKTSQESTEVERPALTPEARENAIIAACYDLAEKQIMEGTASSQVITHFLKLGSTKEKQEKEKMEEEIKLLKAKTECLEATKNMDGFMKEVLAAMKTYSGTFSSEETNADEQY